MVVERVGATHGLRGRWVQRTQQIRLLKYYFAMRAWFPLCRVFCICMDGVRAGNIERVCGALLGTQRLSGQTRMAWLPPQDLMVFVQLKFSKCLQTEETVFSGFFRFAPVSSGFLRCSPVSCFRLQTVFSGSLCSVVSVNAAGQAAGHHGHCLPPAKGGASAGPVQAEGN
jgi:hypothetical protein